MSPALIAALAQGAIVLINYLDGLPAQERQAAVDALNAARTGATNAVDAFQRDSAADLASAMAAFRALTGHPLVQQDGLADGLAQMGKEFARRWSTPLPSGQLVKDPG